MDFNYTYIFAATSLSGLFVGYLIYYLFSKTKPIYKLETRATETRVPETRPLFRTGPDHHTDDEDADDKQDAPKKKIGVKKAAKLEMKAEKRAAREAMLLEREEKKKEQEYLDQVRREEEEKLKKEDEEREEQERLAREEQARKEHEAYLELAASFQVEEEGFDPEQEEDNSAKLAQFISYINEQKVVLLEDVASHFKMRTTDVLDRIQQLIADESLIGFIDDRGKFIGVTKQEKESFAKFIRQRGRVTVDELVVNSNKLINLKPQVKVS